MKRILIILLALLLIPTAALCSTTKVLDKDTELHPQGWTSGSLLFKQGSSVELNDQGEVVSGVLKSNAILHAIGRGRFDINPISNYLYFKSDSALRFDEQGFVISGTLADDTYLFLIYISEPQVKFQGGTTILFSRSGDVLKGTLNKDTSLRPSGWKIFLPNNAGFLTFKAGTEVTFGPAAQIIKGTIASDLALSGITYPAGTTLQFSESAPPQKL